MNLLKLINNNILGNKEHTHRKLELSMISAPIRLDNLDLIRVMDKPDTLLGLQIEIEEELKQAVGDNPIGHVINSITNMAIEERVKKNQIVNLRTTKLITWKR